jgi:hypothetical protein
MSVEPLSHTDHDTSLLDELRDPPPAEVVPSAPPPPAGRREQRRELRLRARQAPRIVRRVDPWSVLKMSAVLYACLWFVLMVAGVILWQIARATGTLDNFEDFLANALADSDFTISGGRVLLSSLLGGVVWVFAGTALTVLLAVLFNLVSEITGGVRVAVVELETAEPVDADGQPIG